MRLPISLLSLSLLCLSSIISAQQSAEEQITSFFNANTKSDTTSGSGHTNNWAVLVCASRYWFNYRHMANALGMYRTVKRLGIPDSNIILMLSDDAACNTRNKFPGCVFASAHGPGRATGKGGGGQDSLDLYGDNIEVDYRGYEVTVENFLRVLTGRVPPSVPRSKRLLSNDRSNVFIYMTGHGGNEFLKFQDDEEISAFDIADALEQMWQKKRYSEVLFMIDTCQANTMFSKFYSPNILATGSSEMDEKSYSFENDNDLGVAVIDSYTHYVLKFMEGINKTSQMTMQDLFNTYSFDKFHSTAGVRSDLFNRPLDKTYITDFLGGVSQAEVLIPLPPSDPPLEPESQHEYSAAPAPHDFNTTSEPKEEEVSLFPELATHLLDDAEKSTLRAWTSTAVLLGLVGWVAARRSASAKASP
ncbi:peptidase C13 family-domain-containing protein [Cristinia sonorae]|uniref:Peptidase C13 family-domain-containing protein n=1 Tax=Cristinia sonorae TaxID=1940300 RepID=A0A8K0UHH3_9AGAR|nr:peptidase C13 family-domain-containing protein [Cristinia sonorae]